MLRKYDWVSFQQQSFPTGAEKTKFIDEKLAQNRPVLISLSLMAYGQKGWHIMPVVDATEDQYLLLNYVEADGTLVSFWIDKSVVETVHDAHAGGKEVAFLGHLGHPTQGES
ncbi:MAG: hypothetical protein R3C02_00865 [Planctomycetaceae bacterium]